MFGEIVRNPTLHAEAKRVWSQLRAAVMAPAGEEGVTRVVASRFPLFPQPARAEAEWNAWWAAYFDALQDLPEASLEAAMRAYVREPDAEFLPRPGKLRELAQTVTNPQIVAAEQCARAAAYTPAVWTDRPEHRPEPQRRPPTAEEREKVRQMAVDLAASFKRPPPPLQPIKFRARTDEHGVTAEMRELLARQEQQ